VDGEFRRRLHNSAIEAVYAYPQKDDTLDLNFPGSYKAVEQLQEMFASTLLKVEELPSKFCPV